MSEFGTKRKCRATRAISGVEGTPAVPSACRPQPSLTPNGRSPRLLAPRRCGTRKP